MNKKTFGIKLRKKDTLALYYVIDEAIWSLVLGHHCLDKYSNDYKDKLKTLETLQKKLMIPYLQRHQG